MVQSVEEIIRDIEIRIWNEVNDSIEETVNVSYA